MFIMIDNYDSFVYNLVRYFEELNVDIKVYRNNKIEIEDIERMKPEGIIISPGPKSPLEAGICIDIIKHFKGSIPILGICLGHQTIGQVFGGEIVRGQYPVHGKVQDIRHSGEGIFKNIKNPLKVTRYHSLVISREKLPEEIMVTAETSDKVIMAVQHRDYAIYGVQFHPEAELTECGHELLQNFINICRR